MLSVCTHSLGASCDAGDTPRLVRSVGVLNFGTIADLSHLLLINAIIIYTLKMLPIYSFLFFSMMALSFLGSEHRYE